MTKKAASISFSVFPALEIVVFLCLCAAWMTGCSGDWGNSGDWGKDQSFVQKSKSGAVGRSFFSPSPDDIVLDKSTNLKILKDIISVTFSPSTSKQRAEKIIASFHGKIVGYDYAVNYYQVRFAGASAHELALKRRKLLAQFKEVELTSKTLVSVHKDPYYAR